MLQPPSLHALQKHFQMENLQKMQEMDNVNLLQQKIQSEFENEVTTPPQVSPEILDKYPELVLKAPELLQKFPDLLQKIPNELLVKNPEFLKFLNVNINKNIDSLNDANSSTESIENDSIPMDLSNDKSDNHKWSGSFNEYDYDKLIDRSPLENSNGDEIWCKYLRPFSANETCIDGSTCEDANKDHFHCIADGCNVIFRTKDGVREHAKNHSQQDKVTEVNFVLVNENMCHIDSECQQTNKHYHCVWVRGFYFQLSFLN